MYVSVSYQFSWPQSLSSILPLTCTRQMVILDIVCTGRHPLISWGINKNSFFDLNLHNRYSLLQRKPQWEWKYKRSGKVKVSFFWHLKKIQIHQAWGQARLWSFGVFFSSTRYHSHNRNSAFSIWNYKHLTKQYVGHQIVCMGSSWQTLLIFFQLAQ